MHLLSQLCFNKESKVGCLLHRQPFHRENAFLTVKDEQRTYFRTHHISPSLYTFLAPQNALFYLLFSSFHECYTNTSPHLTEDVLSCCCKPVSDPGAPELQTWLSSRLSLRCAALDASQPSQIPCPALPCLQR